MSERWLRVGRSSDPGARLAGSTAAGSAVQGADAKLLLVFCSDTYDLPELVAGIRGVSKAPLIGCSTAGEIATSGPGDAGVVVVALGGAGFSAVAASASADASLREAAAEVASAVSSVEDRPHRALILLADGLAGDQQEVVRGAYSAVGAAVPLVGGCAGDGLKMHRTFQIHDDDVLTGSVVGAILGSDAPLGIGVRHGWRRVGEPMLVTNSSSNRVHTLDGKPALDVYLERLDAPAEVASDPEAFARFAMTHPFGLVRRDGEEVRFVSDADPGDRSIGCIAAVPQGSLTWLMEGDADSVLEATDAACADALSSLEGTPALGVLAFDCIARRGVLGEEGIGREIARIGELVDGAPVAGFYTYGEFARTHGVTGFHNQTLVVLAVS